MKVQSIIRTIAALGLVSFSLASRADDTFHAKFEAAIAACQAASFNLDSSGNPIVTLPTPAPGQRPELSDAQKALIQECEQAGILPPHPHHHHAQAQADANQDVRQPSSNQ